VVLVESQGNPSERDSSWLVPILSSTATAFDSSCSGLDLRHHHFTRFQKQFHGAMDATTKLLFDEMKKMSDHIDSRFNAIEGRLEGLERRGDADDDRIKPLEEKAEEIAA
jgi:hypothetical protein